MTGTIRRAVAALFCVGDEVMLVRRQDHARAFPGYWACPGGKVEPDEALAPPRTAYCGLDMQLLGALARELNEELGFDLHLSKAEVYELGIATTPPGVGRRFETTFFRIDLASKPAFRLDLREHSHMRWASARTFWQEYLAGQLLCVSAQQQLLRTLAADPQAREVPDLGERPGQDQGLNLSEPICGLRILPLRSHTLPPATHTNAFLLGEPGCDLQLVDPSPGDADEYAKLKTFLQQWGRPQRLVLTHHHPDHHQHAPQLAREWNLPLAMSADTRQRIEQRWGPSYLAGVSTQILAEGDILCTSRGVEVNVIAVPGHDAGQLAFMPKDRCWMITGDLYQGVGTVVIAQPEGHMGTYFRTLKKVIQLGPAVTVPSHGMALPGTRQIRLTLEHRQKRESHIQALWAQGLDVEAILQQEYADVPRALWPLARCNIEAHLQKIREDRMS